MPTADRGGMVKIAAILLALLVAGVVIVRAPDDTPPAPTTPVSGEIVATISHGERVDLDSHTVPGEWTLFEYYADW